ncbi:MAG: hypothetical protein WDZ49_02650 [Litorilinea sp.]
MAGLRGGNGAPRGFAPAITAVLDKFEQNKWERAGKIVPFGWQNFRQYVILK